MNGVQPPLPEMRSAAVAPAPWDGGPARSPAGEVDLLEVLAILRRRWAVILITLAVVVAAVGIYTWTVTPVYRATATLLVDTASRGTGGSGEIPLLADLQAVTRSRNVETQAEILRSAVIYGEALASLDLQQRDQIVGRPEIRPVRLTDIISVSVAATSPQIAALLANLVVDHYIGANREANRQQTRSAREYVAAKLDEVRLQLAQVQTALREYKEQNLTVDLTAESQGLISQITGLESRLHETRAQLAARRAELAAQSRASVDLPAGRVSAEELAAGPTVERLKQRLGELELQRAQLLQEYRPNAPEVRQVERQIDELQDQLAVEARTALAQEAAPLQAQTWALEAQGAALQDALEQARGRLGTLPAREYRLAQLSTDAQTLQQTYQMLNEQYQRLRISEEARLASAQVISPATAPSVPFRPRKSLNLALAVVLGLMLAVALAVLVDRADQRLHSEEDVLSVVPSGILAHVPLIKDVEQVHLKGTESTSSPLLEIFRILRSNILLSSADKPIRSVIVTSSQPGEGKTEVACNLAIAMALDNKQVILVDADLRRPAVHTRLGLDNQIGLSTLTVGGCELDEALQDSAIPGLRVLACGPLPPNPPELLNSQAWRDCLRRLAGQADFVIIDTPPALMFTDAQILASMVDGTLLVVSAKDAHRPALERSTALLQRAGAKLLGAVVNKTFPNFAKGLGKNGYYYDYYHYPSYHREGEGEGAPASGDGRRRRRQVPAEPSGQ